MTRTEVREQARCGRSAMMSHSHELRLRAPEQWVSMRVKCDDATWTKVAHAVLSDRMVLLDGRTPQMTPFEAWAWLAEHDPQRLPRDDTQIG